MAFKTQHLPSPPQYLSIEDIKSAFKSCSIPFSSPCNLGPVPPNKDFTYCSIKIPQSLTFWVWNRGAEKNKERNKQTDQKKKIQFGRGEAPLWDSWESQICLDLCSWKAENKTHSCYSHGLDFLSFFPLQIYSLQYPPVEKENGICQMPYPVRSVSNIKE